MAFLANPYFVLQISHDKTFKIKFTRCPYNNIIQNIFLDIAEKTYISPLNPYKHLQCRLRSYRTVISHTFENWKKWPLPTIYPFSDHCFIILNSWFINLMYQTRISTKRCQLQLSEMSSLWEVTSGTKIGVKSFLNKHLNKKKSRKLFLQEQFYPILPIVSWSTSYVIGNSLSRDIEIN